MESLANTETKKMSLEEMTKDDLIKKCNHLLAIARKAKLSKDEMSDELKKSKENEKKLACEIDVLKEVMESVTEKQTESAEVSNRLKTIEEKYGEVQNSLKKTEENYGNKVLECSKLEETSKTLRKKISDLEITNADNIEKLSDFRESYAKLDIENKLLLNKLHDTETSETEVKKKLQIAEEKYRNLELELLEFQDNYLEKRKNYEELQETLGKLQSRASSERPSPTASLRPVVENQEYDELLEKYNILNSEHKANLALCHTMQEKLNESEKLISDWTAKHEALGQQLVDILSEKKQDIENLNEKLRNSEHVWINKFDALEQMLTKAQGKLKEVNIDKENEIQHLTEKMNKSEAMVRDWMAKCEALSRELTNIPENWNQVLTEKDQQIQNLNGQVQSINQDWTLKYKALSVKMGNEETWEKLFNEKKSELVNLTEEKETVKKRAEKVEKEITELVREKEELKQKVDELRTALDEKLFECDELQGKLFDAAESSRASSDEVHNLTEKMTEMEKCFRDQQTKESQLLEKVLVLEEELKESHGFSRTLSDELEKTKAAIRSTQVEKEELEKALTKERNDKSKGKLCSEEMLKERIEQLNQQLVQLRKENASVDNKYKEMHGRLEESRNTAEALEKVITEKCEEYERFQAQVESCERECQMLRQREAELLTRVESCECDELRKSLAECRDTITRLQEVFKQECGEAQGITHGFAVDSQQLIQDFLQASSQLKALRDKSEMKLMEKEQEILRLRRELEEDAELCQGRRVSAKENGRQLDVLQAENDRLRREAAQIALSVQNMRVLQGALKEEWSTLFEGYQRDQSQTCQNLTTVVLPFVNRLQSGNSELLAEMNVMNQVVKERGETVSRLEQFCEKQYKESLEAAAKITALESRVQERKKRVAEVEEECGVLKAELERKMKVMQEMEEEMWRIKNNEAQTEVLSTSTLSRVEESARLADLDESFEERYTKLKVLALKLKKKVSELQKELEDERKKLMNERNEFQTKVTHFQAQAKSLSVLQLEYDKLQDVLDDEKKEKNALKKSLEMVHQELEAMRHQAEEMRADKEKFRVEKNSFDIIKKELTGQISALKKSCEKEQTKAKQIEKEVERLEGEMKLRDRRVEEESERHKKTLALLEEQKMESKKHSVLSLEMADYERTVTELSKKLEVKEQNVMELESHLETQRELSKSHQETISRLESALTTEQQRLDELNGHVKQLNQELCDLRAELKNKLSVIAQLEELVEEKKSETENLSLEFAALNKEHQMLEERRRSAHQQLSKQIHFLEDNLASAQDMLNQREMELSELKKEFEGYKVRAQSVLRQSQKDSGACKQKNTLEELEQLRNTSDSLKTRLEDSAKKMQSLVEENGAFLEEKTRLFARVQELTSLVTELRKQNQELKEGRLKEKEEHREALRMQKLQADTLTQCFQKQLQEVEAKYKTEIAELKTEHEQLQIQFQLHLSTDYEGRRDESKDNKDHFSHRRSASANFVPVKTEREMLDVMMLEREECEGSESVDSNSSNPGPSSNNLIPLDQLLNHSEQENVEAKKSPMIDLTQLNERLEKSENRVKHLTVLLSDAESDSARLKQLNDVLKEEIRRNQRSAEREKHAQNFEYLKNVVLKFISLQSIDEKLRLVPVLNTILKLSPEEENVLSNAAKGILEQSQAGRGWSSYLNIWPSAQ